MAEFRLEVGRPAGVIDRMNIVRADEIMQLKRECADLRQRVHDVEIQMQM